MAKPNLTEVYEALRVAEAEGRTDDVAKLINYIESVQAAPDIAAEDTFDPRELISPMIPAAGGAAAGAILPKVIESGVDAMEAGRKPQGVLSKSPISISGVPEGHTPYNPKGRSVEGSIQNWRSYNDAQLEAAKKIRQESAMHKKYPGFTRAGTNPVLAPLPKNAAPAERIAAKILPGGASDIANFAKGVYDYRLPFVGSVGSLAGRGLVGAGAGIQGSDAYNRYKMGDTTGSVISGIGSVGTAANLIPHPAAKAIGTSIGLSAEAINAYRDAMRRGQIEHGAPEDYERVDEMGNAYAHGGSVYLASGGKPIPNPEDVQGTFSYAPGYYAEVADNIAPDGKTAGYNDATRHMLAAADLTRRIGKVPLVGKHIAGPLVKGLGYGHELANYVQNIGGQKPQTKEDMEQDLYNNALGIQLGQKANSFQDIVNSIPPTLNVRPYRKEAGKAYVRNPQEAGTPYKPFGAFSDGGQVQHFQVGGKAVSSGLDALRNLIKAENRTPIVPMPNRWFTKPEDFPQMQGMVGKVLDKNQMGRDAFHSGAFVDPRTGQILDSNIYNNVGVLIDPFTGRPIMSAGDLSGIESLKDLGGKAGNQTLSNLVRKGLFKHTGGDKMLADTPFIATVEQGGMGHKYGLGTEYASPTEMYNTMRGNNPTLRPKSRGDVFGMGDVVGQVQIGGPSGLRHDVYENLFVAPKGSDVQGVKLNKAAGGLAHLAGGGQPPKPDADEGAAFIGYRPVQRQEKNRYGSGTGFLDALVGAPPSKENILDPRDLSYMQGYEKGEPYGIAAMALPFAGMAAKPLAKEIGTRAFMGESLAPKSMRQFMPEAQPAGIIKNEKGGNWMPGNIRPGEHWTPEDQLAETFGFHKSDPALENWVNTQLTRYVKNEMGSPDDSIRKLADQGILHFKPRSAYSAHNNQPTNLQREAEIKRTYAGTPEGESALTQLGKDWETNVDAGIRSKTIGPRTIESYGEEFPWLKNAEGKKLQSIDDEFLYSHLGFDHMVDVLREQLGSGALRAESMKSLSVPQAVQRVHDYNLAREKAMQKVQLQAQSEMPVAKEYPEQGYKWLELKHPTDPSVTEKALKYEGDAMGHCVGGYCPDVESGSTKIYSLRDAKGEPHVTIEVRPGNHHIGFEYPQGANSNAQFPKDFYYTDSEGIRQSLPPQQHAAIYSRAKELFDQNPGSVMKNLQKAADEVLGAPPSKIQQIKGKQNAAVKDEYKPFVQDFVRSGKWEDVKDYQNAGLKNMDMTGSNYELTNVPEDIAKISNTERYHAVQEAVANKDIPKYATEEEVVDAIRKYARKHNEGGLVGYADGGSVTPALPANYQQARSAFDQQQATNFPMGQMRATVVGNDQFGQQFGYAADADAFNTFYNQNYSGSTPVPQGGMPNIALPAMGVNPDGTTTPAPPQIWNERTGQYQSQTDTTPGAMPGPIGGLGGLLAGNNPTAPVGIVSPGMGVNADGTTTPNAPYMPIMGGMTLPINNPTYSNAENTGGLTGLLAGNNPATPVNNIPVAPTPQANPITQQVSNLPMPPNSPVAAATPSANVQNRPRYVPPPKTFNQFGTAINQVRQARPATPQVQPTRKGFSMSPLANLRRR
jgi:hypothetical protein